MGQTASEIKGRAQEAASSVADKAREAASIIGQKTSEVASNVVDKADDTAAAVGSGMHSLAGTIREKLPHEGRMGSASTAVADTLDSGARYLKDEGVTGMMDDLTGLIRRNPIPALLVGIGIGFLIARSTRS
jgi:hypothetical protein